MEKLVPYFSLIGMIAAIIVVALLALSVIGQNKLFKNIISNKFAMHDIEEVDIESGKKTFSLIVANKSMNDAALSSIGVVSGLDFFDFNEKYKTQKGLTADTIVIQPRTPVKLVLDIEEVKKLVYGNIKDGKFKKIQVYVIDSTGNLFVHKAKNFDKILRKAYKEGKGLTAPQTEKTAE